jgi:hypothetical protein
MRADGPRTCQAIWAEEANHWHHRLLCARQRLADKIVADLAARRGGRAVARRGGAIIELREIAVQS